jgi:hypothetical protein
MLTLLGLGFVLVMRHALEADHAAAVASLALKSRSISQTLRQGLAWGIGHTLTLLFFSSLVLLLGLVIPEQFAEALEFAVGLMLIGLGIDVFRRMSRERIHFHLHEHQNEPPHFHAHIHDPQDHHETASSHNHAQQLFPLLRLSSIFFSLGWDPHSEWAFSHWSWLFPFGIPPDLSVGGTTASKLASEFRQPFLGSLSSITIPTGFGDNRTRHSLAENKKGFPARFLESRKAFF